MAAPIFLYRVFVASPSDLKDERVALMAAIEEYNKNEALDDGIMFYPVRWEDVPPTKGRPQSHLNMRLRECDFFFLMLWKRWGSPPSSTDSLFSSGTEEEYEEAKECCNDHNFPMRDLAIAFKNVDESFLEDPGAQLSSVLDFRERLASTKEAFFTTFYSEGDLQAMVRSCLSHWKNNILQDSNAPRQDPRDNTFQYTGDRISLNFEDIGVRAILQLLADFTGLNIVASDTVRGNLTLRLKNVPWDQALKFILSSKGLSMRQEGNVIMIAPTQEIAAQEKLELEQAMLREQLRQATNSPRRAQ